MNQSLTQAFAAFFIRSAAACGCAVGAVAGPLAPPAGPVASTGKTLVEVEPRVLINAVNTPGDADSQFRIGAAGSYYLGGNINGVSGKVSIEVSVSGVTIDLMGFSIQGAAGAIAGVRAGAASLIDVAVLNGGVTGFPGSGLELSFPNRVEGCLIQGVRATSNGGVGISAGNNAVVRDCVSLNNGGIGIAAGNNSAIQGCASQGNTSRGFLVGLAAAVQNCTAFENGSDGFNLAGGGSITNCVAVDNAADGFDVSSSVVTACTANSNDFNGIRGGGGSVVSGCSSTFNGFNGVEVDSDCVVLNSVADSNGTATTDGAGVAATGLDNRIDGNNCSDNDIGVTTIGAGSLIVRNTCSGNTTNFLFPASNRYGPIVNITAAGAAPVSGNTAVGTLTSTDPWANFAY